MHEPDGLSSTHEMYLKVLYRLQQEDEVARVRDMAKGLGVTPGTVSAVLKKLQFEGLVLHDRYGYVKLTPAGTRVGECVVRRFDIILAFLTDVLALPSEAAEVDACQMEHAVSPATVNRIEYLVQLVQAGTISVTPMHGVSPTLDACTECDSLGTCQTVGTRRNEPASTPENDSTR